MKEHFDKVDANQDGFADAGELQKAIQMFWQQAILKNVGEQLKKADKNGDRKLSKEEAPEPLKANVEKVDENQDGFVDGQEVMKALNEVINRALNSEG